jgi:hypothetical protein
LSRTTTSGLELGNEDLIDISLKGAGVDRPVQHHGRDHPGQAERADQGRRFPMSMGTLMRRRLPRGARPYRRAMLVVAQVSSMNRRRSGSRSSCPSNQSSRRFTMSGRSCSLACAVFFARHLVSVEEPPQRSVAHEDPVVQKRLAKLLDRAVRRGLNRRQNGARMRFRLVRAAVPADGLRRGVSLRPLERPPSADARGADAKATSGASTRSALGDRRQNPYPKIRGKRLGHLRRPPARQKLESDHSRFANPPSDSVGSDDALGPGLQRLA